MKKLIALLCAFTCILSLTACGEAEQSLSAEEQVRVTELETHAGAEIADFLGIFINEDAYKEAGMYNAKELEYIMNMSLDGVSVEGSGFKSALESFYLSGQTTGFITDIKNVRAKVDGNRIIVSADAVCEKKDATIELIFTNDLFLTLVGGSLNPISDFGELMEKAALNTVLGMGTVFAVLILISIIIACFIFVPRLEAGYLKFEAFCGRTAKKIKSLFSKKKDITEGIDKAVARIEQQESMEQPGGADPAEDTELVAVIAAAIAAYEGSTNTEGFVVRSIRRR